MEKNWGNPAPTGFAAFAMITGMLGLNFAGYLPHENFAAFFALSIAGGAAQIISGIIDLKRGEDFAGNLLLTMGCLFFLAPGLTILLTAMKLTTPVPILGYLFIMLGIFLALYIIPMVRAPWFVFTMGPIGAIGLFEIGLIDLGYVGLKPIGAITMAYLCFWALYMVAHNVALPAGINIPLGKPLTVAQPKSSLEQPVAAR